MRFFRVAKKLRKCPICRAEPPNLTAHMHRVHGMLTPLECDWCQMHFWTTHEMEKHLKTHLRAPARRGKYKCTECARRFYCNGTLLAHLRNEHQLDVENPFQCETCRKSFRNQGSLNIHYRMHTGERPFPCSLCEKAYATRNRLNLHVKRTHKDLKKEHTCEVCGKLFENHSTLMFHRKIHFADARTERCEICGWSTYSKGNLKKHLTTHTNNKPFVCEECGKRFAEKFVLLKHMQVHDPDRELHKCKLCEKTFVTAHSLKIHLRRHQGENKYECDLCEAGYTLLNHLLRHKWEKHNVMPYKCEVCDESFTHLRAMKEHSIQHFTIKP